MVAATHLLKFHGNMLARGFWLYVWEVRPHVGDKVYYVGRTGDSSTINAQSPFIRMGQHLGFAKNSCMLRRWLEKRGIEPGRCSFKLTAYGPVLKETKVEIEYRRRRDIVAAIERELERAMRRVGYDVLNTVKSNRKLHKVLCEETLNAFKASFPRLRTMQMRSAFERAPTDNGEHSEKRRGVPADRGYPRQLPSRRVKARLGVPKV
jgi:hypothetical protein